MKFPKEMRRFCKSCKKHTLHKVKIEKNKGKNKARPMSQFSQIRLKLRGLTTGLGNKGARSRGALNSWKRFNKKHSKKTDLRYICQECSKMSTSIGGIGRSKKFALE